MNRFIFSLYLCSSSLGYANSVGSSVQNFNPTTNGLDFITVQSSDVLLPGVFSLGIFSDYAVNTLTRYGKGESSEQFKDGVHSAEVSLGYGLTRYAEMGLSIPTVLSQTRKIEGDRIEFKKVGLTEVRPNLKLRLYGNQTGGLSVIVSHNINLLRNDPFTGEGSHGSTNYEIAADTTVSEFALGVNIGYRNRDRGSRNPEYPLAPLHDQILISFASNYSFQSLNSKAVLEVYTTQTHERRVEVIGRNTTAGEILVGWKSDLTNQVALSGGMTRELLHGISSADWRVFAGIHMNFASEKGATLVKLKKPLNINKPKDSPPVIKLGAPACDCAREEVFVLQGANFAFDSEFRVLPGAVKALEKVAVYAKKVNAEKIVLEGHTDSIGTNAYNLRLGLLRANAVRNHLVIFGKLNGEIIDSKSFGEERPVSDNTNYQSRQLNRRVVIRIFYHVKDTKKGETK